MSVSFAGNSLEGPFAQGPAWEKKENPQAYDQFAQAYVHALPARHIVGLVGGNEASLIKGNQVDLESDLRGLNLPNTFCPERKYLPPSQTEQTIKRDNVKIKLAIDVKPQHLPVYQLWAYPAVPGPELLKVDQCGRPERF